MRDAARHAMKAGELCIRDVVTAYQDEPVFEAARRMKAYGVGSLIVVAREAPAIPLGVVTDRDLVVHVLAEEDQRLANVADVMRHGVVVTREDADIESVIASMRDNGIRRMPIVDGEGRLQGILTVDDVLGWLREQLYCASKIVERQGVGPRGRVLLPGGTW